MNLEKHGFELRGPLIRGLFSIDSCCSRVNSSVGKLRMWRTDRSNIQLYRPSVPLTPHC